MRFGSGLAFVYDETWAFIRRAWWLALVPLLPLTLGSLTLFDASQPLRWDPALWGALFLSAILKAALPYWVMRFIALNHDVAAAVTVNRDSARTFAPYLATMTALNLVLLIGTTFGDDEAFTVGFGLGSLFVLPLLSPWSVTAPSGAAVIGPAQSIRLVLPHLFWAITFMVVVLIPATLLELVSVALAERSALPLLVSLVQSAFNAILDVLFTVALFAIALKAGLRIGADRSVAAVFD